MTTPVLYGIEIEVFPAPLFLTGVEIEFAAPVYGKKQEFSSGSKTKTVTAATKTKEVDN